MALVVESFASTDVPLVCPPGTTDCNIVVGLATTIVSVTIDVNITSPDEGSGPDAALLILVLYDPTQAYSNTLQNSDPASLAGINFDNGRVSLGGMNTIFAGVATTGTWKLGISNFSGSANATVNSLILNVTYELPPETIRYPSAPAAITIPGGIKYGQGENTSKNIKLFFSESGLNTKAVLDTVRYVPFNAFLENTLVCVKNSGSTIVTKLNLHRVRNGADTVLVTDQIKVNPGLNYYSRRYPNKKKALDDVDIVFNKALDAGDVLYFSVEAAGTALSDLCASITLKQRN